MAQVTSGSFTTNRYTDPDGDYKWLVFSWSASQSTANNQSTISWTLKGAGNSGYLLTGPITVVIDGATVYSSSARIELRDGTVVASGSKVLTHTTTGSRSFSASVSAAIYTFAVSSTGSGSWDLKDIPRASTPSCASSAKMKGSLTISTNRASSSFTHTLSYKFGTSTGTIATDIGASYTWTIPDLAAYCNDETSGTMTITCVTYNGSTNIGSKTCTLTLNVPDASTHAFTNGNSKVVIGSNNAITTTAGSSNFTHTITYSFNGATGTIVTKGKSGFVWYTSYDLAKKIPSATSGTGRLTCITYNGTATVGTTYVDFTASVPNNTTTQPEVTAMALVPTGSLPSAFAGLYVQSKTGVKATFTASSEYSTIKSYKITVGGKTYTGNPATSNILMSSGELKVVGVVTDARGYTTTVEATITVLPYSVPKVIPGDGLTDIICERCTSDGTYSDSGTYLHIKAQRSYSKVDDSGTQKNFCKLTYIYKATGGAFSSEVTLIAADADEDSIDIIINDIVTSIKTSFVVQLIVTDTIESRNPYTFDIPTASKDFHLREGGNGAAFGKYAEVENLLECEWDGQFNNKLTINDLFIMEQEITVGGEDDMYYPVHIKPTYYGFTQACFLGLGKLLGSTSGTWDGNHSNGTSPITMAWMFRYNGWDGNGSYIKPLWKAETYAKLIAHIEGYENSAKGVVLYLRGGGATYKLACNLPIEVNVYLEATDISEQSAYHVTVSPRTYTGNYGIRYKNSGMGDVVIEEGTVTDTANSCTWHYRKWYSGKGECWGQRSVTAALTTAWGSSLYYGNISAISLPITFSEKPMCIVSAEYGSNGLSALVTGSGQVTVSATPALMLCRPSSSASANYVVTYHVLGKI